MINVDKLKKICFNIWDDYWDDGYVPEGKAQETHGYIEEYELLNERQKCVIVSYLFDYLKNMDLGDTKLKLSGDGIIFTGMTHKVRHKLLKDLQKSKLHYNGVPFLFYSES